MPKATGITERGGRFRAEAYDRVSGRRVYKTFPTLTAAKAWRRDMQVKIARGEARAVDPTTIREAWLIFGARAKEGIIRARGGSEYKPGVLHSYTLSMNGRVLPKFGHVKVGELRRAAIQRYVDELVAEGLAAQTCRNTITALRVLLKWCVREELRSDNPCDGLELPAGGVARDNIMPPSLALDHLGRIEDHVDKAIYATAFFAGLRRGELQGLRWEDVDLAARTVHVRQSWDARVKQFVAPKSKAGRRDLGIPDLLVPYLAALNTTEGLVFSDDKPFQAGPLAKRARAAWSRVALNGERLRPQVLAGTGLHEARHTYASLMIAAGVNIKTISEWMGHSSVTITLDRYGHLLPGSTKVALGLLNDFLAKELSDAA